MLPLKIMKPFLWVILLTSDSIKRRKTAGKWIQKLPKLKIWALHCQITVSGLKVN